MIDEILTKHGLKYEDLNPLERETVNEWVSELRKGALSVERVRDHVDSMKDSVEEELTKIGHDSKQDIFLKARLRNLMLISALLGSPEKVQRRLDAALSGFKNK